jgi:hypothetical protein
MGGALVSLALVAAGAEPDLKQGWSDAMRNQFYYTSQGSRIIPRAWLLALEREDTQEDFLADGLARFGYLPGTKSTLNPDKLPVGFAVDRQGRDAWVGMTCAACHTSEIKRGGITLRIDGGPAGADMYAFLAALDRAAKKAVTDDAAFARFAARVLGPDALPDKRQELRDGGLRQWSTEWAKFVEDSTPSKAKWGPQRLDAFNMIFNRIGAIDLGVPQGNTVPPDAPVSYPFLWGTSHHDKTQWNGAVPNDTPLKRLGRNTGQVLGVFGTIDYSRSYDYRNSVRMPDVMKLEDWVATLKAPEWPAGAFGAPDAKDVKRGATLYTNNCAKCHTPVARQDQFKPVKVTLMPASKVGTDETMTRMAATRILQTNMLEKRLYNYLPITSDPIPLPTLKQLGPKEPAAQVLSHSVVGAIVSWLEHPDAATPKSVQLKVSDVYPMFDNTVRDQNYKARPLNGIWATAPYLHNGSVRTLEQLLLPPAQREATFMVGSREFDPAAVGFVSGGSFLFDTTVAGNSNKGHVYGTKFGKTDRDALIAFLKTL